MTALLEAGACSSESASVTQQHYLQQSTAGGTCLDLSRTSVYPVDHAADQTAQLHADGVWIPNTYNLGFSIWTSS